VIELGAKLVQRRLKRLDILEFGFRQLFEYGQTRTFVGFGEHHVEPDYDDTVFVEQLLQQAYDLVAAPGPATERAGIEAALVDVEDDDASVIDGTGHGQTQPVIVDEIFEPIDEADLVVVPEGVAYDVAYEYQNYQQAERDPDDVLLQSSSPDRF